MDWYVYRIDCEHDVIYIGKTCNLPKRINEHFSDRGGASATRTYRPKSWSTVRVCTSDPEATYWERYETGRLKLLGFVTYGGTDTRVGYVSESSPNHPKNNLAHKRAVERAKHGHSECP